MRYKDRKAYLLFVFIIGFVTGVVAYLQIYGTAVLDVKDDAFLINLGDDLAQHYLGWVFFRFGEWKGPGMFDTMTYPVSTSIIFTDSTPILELFFKLLSPVLPATFQYCGIWGLICFGMQGGMATLILNRFTDDFLLVFLGSIPVILSTPLLTKLYGHHAFGGQFLILLVLAYWLYHRETKRAFWKECIVFVLIGILTSGINLYFVPPVGMVVLGYAVDLILQKKEHLTRGLCALLSFLAGAFLFFVVFGGLSSDFQTDPSYKELYLSLLNKSGANLNTFINSCGIAKIGKDLGLAYPNELEGLAYLGVGVMALILCDAGVIAFGIIIKRTDIKETIKQKRAFLIGVLTVFVLSIMIGVGPTVCWGTRELFKIPYPGFIQSFWSTFRSTGRFIWPAYYIIVLGSVGIWVHQKLPETLKRLLLIVICVVQVADLSPWLMGRNDIYGHRQELISSFQGAEWEYLGEKYEHLVVLPNSILNRSDDRNIIAKWAGDNKITLNDFYLSRQRLEDRTDEVVAEILEGKIDKKTLYMFDVNTLLRVYDADLHLYRIGERYVGTTADLADDLHIEEISDSKGQLIYRDYTSQGLDLSQIFDADYYYEEYPDVREICQKENKQEILEHFLDIGMTEGRRGNASFDPARYRELNWDLDVAFGTDWRRYYLHFVNSGIYEGREI